MVDFTTNYHLAKPDFNISPWHDDVNGNMDVIDSVLFALTGIGNVKGIWTNSTSYVAGDRVVDNDDGTLWRCLISNTSGAAPQTFAQYRAANPTHWEVLSITFGAATTWQTATAYSVNDFLIDGARYGVAVNNFTSGASYNADVGAGNIITLIDLSGFVPNSAFTAADRILYSTGVGVYTTTPITAFGRSLIDDAAAVNGRATLGVVIGTDVQAFNANLSAIAGLAVTDSNIIVGNGTTWVAETGATARTSLGLTIGTNVQAFDQALTDISGLAVTDGNFIVGNGTNWVAESGATVRTSLGLGTAATVNTGTSGAVIPLLNGANTWSAQQTFATIQVDGNLVLQDASSNLIFSAADTDTYLDYAGLSGEIRFVSDNVEVVRLTNTSIHVGRTTATPTDIGCSFQNDGQCIITVDAGSNQPFILNRQADDGVLINMRQANVTEGTISVAGTTISYNAFLGSHWSQFADGHREELPIGTIVDSISQMCNWPQDGDKKNDRLPCFKVSEIDASKAVYGVFIDWDNDEEETNDAYIASLGAGWVRLRFGEVVEVGDLICHASDGCGRVQDDDLFHSYTVAKVTSTEVVEVYSDGSFRVPATLHCG